MSNNISFPLGDNEAFSNLTEVKKNRKQRGNRLCFCDMGVHTGQACGVRRTESQSQDE